MVCKLQASPQRLILNKFRINGMFGGENLGGGFTKLADSLSHIYMIENILNLWVTLCNRPLDHGT